MNATQQAIEIDLNTIPAELKARHQWVVWRYEWRADRKGEQKLTKVPYSPRNRGSCASSTDPRTWSALEQALEVRGRDGYDGIGYVFSETDPYCGIDLDKCIEDDGALTAWASELVEDLDSYTEITPSGRGLHVIVKAALPPGRRRKGPVEMYDEGRYFTMTGQRWPGARLTIEARQEVVEEMHGSLAAQEETVAVIRREPQPVDLDDQALLDKAMNATNGAAFAALWRGDIGAYDSGSEADLALCNMLAFWTGGDEHRVDTLFRQSGLYREKWDKRHYSNGATYGEATISKALAGAREFYRPGQRHEGGGQVAVVAAPHIDPDNRPVLEDGCPPLREEATYVYEYLSDHTGRWLQDYVAFASQAAPMTPRSFHEAAALFAGSTAIARRLRLSISTTHFYPNLFLLFIAPSTLYSKTTGFRLLSDLFRQAQMEHYLLPERMTPEAMVQELSLGVPHNLNMADQEARHQWLYERAFAAKRGWAIDEAHSLFDSLKRDYNTGLMAMMLSLYECPERTTEQTVGRWRVTVRRAYLSFFGATTPSSAAEHLTNSTLWSNGLWARFAFITPDESPIFQFFPDEMNMPRSLIQGLQGMACLFPTPHAELKDIADVDGTTRKVVEVIGEENPTCVMMDPGVKDAWEAYGRATRFDMLLTGEVEPELRSSYGRLFIHAIKVAMILATMDTERLPVRITLAHYAHAQRIVEGWRACLHRLRHGTVSTQEESARDKILGLLTQTGQEGILIRDVYRTLGMKAKDVREHLAELQAAGQAELFGAVAANGRKVEMVRRCAVMAPASSAAA